MKKMDKEIFQNGRLQFYFWSLPFFALLTMSVSKGFLFLAWQGCCDGYILYILKQ